MEFLPVLDLQVIGVHDAGVPDRERIVLRAMQQTNLAQFGLLLVYDLKRADDSYVTFPVDNYFYWFGDTAVAARSWIVIYTGKGVPRAETFDGDPVYYWFWNNEATLFADPRANPMLIRLASVSRIPRYSVPALGSQASITEQKTQP